MAEVGGAYHHPIIMGENVSDLWNTSNAQKDGLFIYEISTNTPTQSRCSSKFCYNYLKNANEI